MCIYNFILYIHVYVYIIYVYIYIYISMDDGVWPEHTFNKNMRLIETRATASRSDVTCNFTYDSEAAWEVASGEGSYDQAHTTRRIQICWSWWIQIDVYI